MEAIGDFCRNNDTTNLSLIQVVVGQRYMVTSCLEKMESAVSPGSCVYDVISAPLRYFGDTVYGMIQQFFNATHFD